ncbi:MAG: T9SS type A sorting domain-containing protein [Bacteroidia bacterium]
MRRRILPTLLLLLPFFALQAQIPTLDWAISDPSDGFDLGRAVALDAQGNAIVVGIFQDTCDMDPGPNNLPMVSHGDNDAFIQKLNSFGDLVWATCIGSTGVDEAKGVDVDAAGNIYITGRFTGTVDFNPGNGTANTTSMGPNDIFVLKLTANGAYAWHRTWGSTSYNEGTAIQVDGSRVTMTGYIKGTVDLNPTAGTQMVSTPANSDDIIVVTLDDQGNYIWGAAFGGVENDFAYAVNRNGFGGVVVTGTMQDTVDFEPGTGVTNLVADPGVTSAFILNLDANGALVWARQINTTDLASGYGIDVDADGDVYVAGACNGIIDFDPGSVSNIHASAGYDCWLAVYTAAGNYRNAWAWGSTSGDYAYGLGISPKGDVYVAGGYEGTVDFDPTANGAWNITAGGMADAFISRFDTSGNFHEAISNGNTGMEYAFGIVADMNGSVLSTGCFGDTVDFDPGAGVLNLVSAGSAEIFVQQLHQCHASYSNAAEVGCDAVTVNNQTYSVSGVYTQTFTNSDGCDSILTITVTINTVDTTVTGGGGNPLVAQATGATYQWLDCDNGFAPISGETNATFSPSITGHYAVAVTQNGCTDTSGCHEVIIIGVQNPQSQWATASPNPNNGTFTLQLTAGLDAAEVVISDALGRVIESTQVSEKSVIEIDGKAGLYFLRVRTAEGEQVLRMVKQD